jgi:energy-converting hydrogenase Eha subunit H
MCYTYSMIIFKWLLVPAAVLVTVGVVSFIAADMERMRTLRSAASGVIVLACLLTVAAGLGAWFGRKRL